MPARQCEHIYLFERVFEKVVSGALLRHRMWEEALLDISAKGGGARSQLRTVVPKHMRFWLRGFGWDERAVQSAMYSRAEYLYHMQNVRRAPDIGGEVVETAVQKARKIIAAREAAKKKDLARVSSRAEFDAAPWKHNAKPEAVKKVAAEQTKSTIQVPGKPSEGVASSSSEIWSGQRAKEETQKPGEELFDHPWRKGVAIRLPYRTGSKMGLGNTANDKAAVRKLVNAKFAASTRSSHRSRIKWWTERCAERSWTTTPVTAEKLLLAAALLKDGGYRSACLYLAMMRRMHVQHGFSWTEQLAQEFTDVKRAVLRGLGPDKQAGPLPIVEIGRLTEEELAKKKGPHWPAAGRDVAIVSCAWLCREVEVSTAFAGAITIHECKKGGCCWAEWDLPASKADWIALGKKRSLGCACPSPLCPAAAMKRVTEVAAKVNIGQAFDSRGGPLIPKENGMPMSKKEMVHFFVDLASAVEGILGRITGHSGRVTGAMRMAWSGVRLSKIKVFGRWGSAAVERYVREALLGRAGGDIARMTEDGAEENHDEEQEDEKKVVVKVGPQKRLRRVAG